MIEKIKNCLYCGKEMESITAKKRFCSTKCRVYYNRIDANALRTHSERIEKPIIKPQPIGGVMPNGLSLQERIDWMEKNQKSW